MNTRDHGGNLDAAIAQFGGTRADWLDLSTGINPVAYPVGDLPVHAWTSLPDQKAQDRLIAAARAFWNVPGDAAVLAAPGASAIIQHLPRVLGVPRKVWISRPTYNEWRASFEQAGWSAPENDPIAEVGVYVHPNNPNGLYASLDPEWFASPPTPEAQFVILDESFCDADPDMSYVAHTASGHMAVVKSFGKFWGLAGVRLGFLIGEQSLIDDVAALMGPWPVSGIALDVGARALEDRDWADATIKRLTEDYQRLDALMKAAGAGTGFGTHLFRTYAVRDAAEWQDRLARGHVWSRIFPYNKRWLRLGLPHPDRWDQLEAALT